MSRSNWKSPYIHIPTFNKILTTSNPTIYSRSSVILPHFIGKTVQIHNGCTYVQITITENMIGYKFGEFAATRKKFFFKKRKHGTKNKRKNF